jgi:cis-3-alkyl-4-acyloxetan-2-one decarboxylase
LNAPAIEQDQKERAREFCRPFREEYDFEPNFLETTAGTLHYLDEGSREAAPILCVHGNPTWSFYYRRLVREFRDSHRVIAPDHLGCGLSDKPQKWSFRLEDHIANLERLLFELNLEKVTLVVHDWGGAIGLGAAVRHPERFARILVLNSAAFPADRIPLRINVCRTPFLGELAVRGLNAFARAAATMALEHHERMTSVVRRGYLAPYDSWNNRIATHRFVTDIPMRRDHPSYATLEGIDSGLEKLHHLPMRIAWGEKDWCFTPAFLEMWQARFLDAEVLPIEHAGHYVLEDAHEEILPWLHEFVNRS